jgi:hypothetical protein
MRIFNKTPNRTALVSAIISSVGTGLLLFATIVIGQKHAESIHLYFLYQIVTLALAGIVILAIRFITGRKLLYLRIGEMRGGATKVPLLAIKQGESWSRVGATFAVIITMVTALFLWTTYRDVLAQVTPSALFLALILALPLSFTNAFIEGIVTRWSIAEGFSGSARLVTLAPWVSAFVFGSVHYFGIPGGPVGSIMAGFIAWFLTRSIQDTRGIGWSWLIHFLQDMLIFTVTLGMFL